MSEKQLLREIINARKVLTRIGKKKRKNVTPSEAQTYKMAEDIFYRNQRILYNRYSTNVWVERARLRIRRG